MSSLENIQELIERCSREDRVAQELLYKHMFPQLLSVCMRYAADEEEARDVLNQSFLKIFSKIRQCRQTESFDAWARKIAVRTALDYLRAQRRLGFNQDIREAEGQAVPFSVEAKLDYDDLLQMVRSLPAQAAVVFNLFVVEGYTHREIARQLHIAEKTSRWYLFQARKNLQELLLSQSKK